ncbi:MAG: hypothetical protein AB7R89_10920 [Dehalococcoidia bacterium]
MARCTVERLMWKLSLRAWFVAGAASAPRAPTRRATAPPA